MADPRWEEEPISDLDIDVVGALLYGFAFMLGRTIFFMDAEEIEAELVQVMTERLGVAEKWARGLVEEVGKANFDKSHHPEHHKLIGIGHNYFGADRDKVISNIFANLHSFRQGHSEPR